MKRLRRRRLLRPRRHVPRGRHGMARGSAGLRGVAGTLLVWDGMGGRGGEPHWVAASGKTSRTRFDVGACEAVYQMGGRLKSAPLWGRN